MVGLTALFNTLQAFSLALIPLVVSFFVLFASRHLEKTALKSFAEVLAVLLWISSAIGLFIGVSLAPFGPIPAIP